MPSTPEQRTVTLLGSGNWSLFLLHLYQGWQALDIEGLNKASNFSKIYKIMTYGSTINRYQCKGKQPTTNIYQIIYCWKKKLNKMMSSKENVKYRLNKSLTWVLTPIFQNLIIQSWILLCKLGSSTQSPPDPLGQTK